MLSTQSQKAVKTLYTWTCFSASSGLFINTTDFVCLHVYTHVHLSIFVQSHICVCEKSINPEFYTKSSALTELICVPAQAVFARGISAVWENYICVGKYWVTYIYKYIQNTGQNSTVYHLFLSLGVSSGAILVFDVPSKGSNITLSEVLEEHTESITDMASECSGSQVWPVCACSVCASSVVFLSEPLLIQDSSNFSMNDRLPK